LRFFITFETRPARDNARESYCWALRKAQVIVFVKLLYPYLKVKRKHAEVIMRYPRTYPGKTITDDVYTLREKLYSQLRELTHKGCTVRD
jgi:hypothetical protein